MSKLTIPLLLTGLLLATHTTSAQTALITHRSHGGPARTFQPGSSAHDFGIVPVPLRPVKFVYLEGARAVRYCEKWRAGRQIGPTRIDTIDVRQLTGQQFPDSVLLVLRRWYPQAQLIGFQSRKLNETWPSIN